MEAKHKVDKVKVRRQKVMFTMPAITGCNCLYLVGKFDDWNESVYRMQRADDGTWSLILELEPGQEYQYRYRTDTGVWYTAPAAGRHAPRPEESDNTVV